MSQKETTATVGRLEAGESQVGNLSGLTELAREAFEQKRTKDCLDLTRAMLLVDPGNADAQSMRLSIQSEMHRDLDSARAFIRQAQSKESREPLPHLVARETELEGHEESGTAGPGVLAARAVLWLSDFFHSQRRRGFRWLLVATAIIVGGVVLVAFPWRRTSTPSVESSLLALGAPDVSKSAVGEEIRAPIIERPADLVAASTAVPARIPLPVTTAVATAVPRPVAAVADAPVAAGTGILAVSSPSAIDIYEGDAYLGSVPVSLELSAGEHTLEYRHGSLRKLLTHVVNRNETAKATVTFDVTLPVNSKPWSEVFLDGVERKDLGQTPLSSVRVPIGGVLIFENPQFQAKRYRVTGNETGIQVVFP